MRCAQCAVAGSTTVAGGAYARPAIQVPCSTLRVRRFAFVTHLVSIRLMLVRAHSARRCHISTCTWKHRPRCASGDNQFTRLPLQPNLFASVTFDSRGNRRFVTFTTVQQATFTWMGSQSAQQTCPTDASSYQTRLFEIIFWFFRTISSQVVVSTFKRSRRPSTWDLRECQARCDLLRSQVNLAIVVSCFLLSYWM